MDVKSKQSDSVSKQLAKTPGAELPPETPSQMETPANGVPVELPAETPIEEVPEPERDSDGYIIRQGEDGQDLPRIRLKKKSGSKSPKKSPKHTPEKHSPFNP